MLNQSEKDDLESLIDKYDLGQVLAALADIANEKGDHLRSNWQDVNAAKSWERDARVIDKAGSKLQN